MDEGIELVEQQCMLHRCSRLLLASRAGAVLREARQVTRTTHRPVEQAGHTQPAVASSTVRR